jgi:hypothetical protein
MPSAKLATGTEWLIACRRIGRAASVPMIWPVTTT